MIKKPRVCVLLATFNGAKYVQEQIDSIRLQKNCRCVIIARDDGSSDETVEILKKNNINILNGSKKMIGASMNFFSLIKNFTESDLINKFDFVALSDQDDIWMPNKINRAISKLNEGYDFYSSGFLEYKFVTGRWKTGRYVKKTFNITALSYLARSPGPGFTYVFNPKAIKVISCDPIFKNFFQNKSLRPLWHDWALFAFAMKLSLSWKIDDVGLSYYRIHRHNHTGLLSFSNFVSRFKFFFSKNYINEILKVSIIRGDLDIQRRLEKLSFSDRIFFISKIGELRSGFIERCMLLILFVVSKKTSIQKK